jgi:hypothetical protein
MISFLIAIKDEVEIDLDVLEFQVVSCLRVKAAQVCIGLSADAHGHLAIWRARPKLQNERVSFTITQDRGLCEGWNRLVERANTPWVSFLGLGDVVLSPEHFERSVVEPSGKNAHFSKVLIFGGKRNRIFGRPFRPWRHKFMQEAAHAGALFDRMLLLEAPYDMSYVVAGDYEWLLRCSSRLKASFDPIVAVAMPAGGMSESMATRAKAEIKRAKRDHAVA